MTNWSTYVLDRSAPTDLDAMTDTVDWLFDALDREELIDLRNLDPNTVNGEQLCLVLRATYSIQDQVPGWHKALEVARAALIQVNVDPADALIGLDQAYNS